MEHKNCPTDFELARYKAGQVSEFEINRIADHVDGCPACLASLETAPVLEEPLLAGQWSHSPELELSGDDKEAYQNGLAAALELGGKLLASQESDQFSTHTSVAPPNVLGDYRIISELGRGGMGVVYEAKQISLGRRVALKVLPLAGLLNPLQLARFENEARAAACLNHDNIVPVYGIGSDRGMHFYAMQIVNGTDLAALLQIIRNENDLLDGKEVQCAPTRKVNDSSMKEDLDHQSIYGPNTNATAVRDTDKMFQYSTDIIEDNEYLRTFRGGPHSTGYIRFIAQLGVQAARALEYAHSQGVVHRDVKPSNLMLDKSGKLWLSDFGVARIEAEAGITTAGEVIGTLRYMSPEQALGQDGFVDHRADVYSLGATLYELLTLRPIFKDEKRTAVIEKIKNVEPAPPSFFNRKIPLDLETIILKAISKEITERYTTAGVLANDLQRFLNAEPIQAKRPTTVDRVAKWIRRHRMFAAASSVAVGLFVAVLLAFSAFTVNQNTLIRESREAARLTAYAMSMRLAFDSHAQNDAPQAINWLNASIPNSGEPDYRGFEWNYLKRLLTETKKHRQVSDLPLRCVSVSPDGSLLAWGGEDGLIEICSLDSPDPEKILSIESGQSLIQDLAFSPQGSLVSAGVDGSLKHWDPISGSQLWETSVHSSPIRQVGFIDDGSRIISVGNDWVLRIWNATTGEVVDGFSYHESPVTALTVSPQRDQFVTSSDDGKLRFWDAKQLNLIRTSQSPNESCTTMAFSTDGTCLVTGHVNGELFLWPVGLSNHYFLGQITDPVEDVEFTDDGRQLLIADRRGTLHRWRYDRQLSGSPSSAVALNPQEEWLFQHEGRLGWCGFSDDGNTAAALYKSTITFRDLISDEIVKSPLRDANFLSQKDRSRAKHLCDFSPDGQTFVCANEVFRRIPGKLFDWEWESFLDFGDMACFAVEFAPNDNEGVFVALGNGEIYKFDLNTGKVADDPEHPYGYQLDRETPLYQNEVLTVSPNGRNLASSSRDETFNIFDLQNFRHINSFEGHGDVLLDLEFSPDGRHLASAGIGRRQARIYDILSGQVVREMPLHCNLNRSIDTVSYSADGKMIATGVNGDDGSLRIWDLITDREVWYRQRGADVVQFSADGNKLLSTDYHSGWFCWWDLTVLLEHRNSVSGKSTSVWRLPKRLNHRAIRAHSGCCYDIALTRTGVVTVGSDGILKTWDQSETSSEQLLESSTAPAGGNYDFSLCPTGNTLAVMGPNTLQIYDQKEAGWEPVRSIFLKNCRTLAFTAEGREILTGQTDGTLSIRNLQSLKSRLTLKIDKGNAIRELAVSPTGKIFAVCLEKGDDRIRLFDLNSLKRLEFPRTASGHSLIFSPSGENLAFADGMDIVLWNLQGKPSPIQMRAHSASVRAIAFDPSGHLLASGADDRRIILWEANTGKTVQTLDSHSGSVRCLGFSPDGRSLVSSDIRKETKVWHLATQIPLGIIIPEQMDKIVFSSDSRTLIYLNQKGQLITTSLGSKR